MIFYVYIIRSLKDKSYYIGYTANLENRVWEHNFGSTRYTSHKRPWELVYSEEFENKRDALKRERFLKKQKNRAFYQRLIDNSR